jgi:8-amino-7-oxononanoate synthase
MSHTLGLENRIRRRLAAIDAAGLRRKPKAPAGMDLCSNDYLGLAAHPVVKQRMAEAVLAEGCGATGSRLLRGERDVFRSIERRFARFKQTELSLYFSSGYLANLGVLSSLLERGDVVFSDEMNHASLIDGIRLSPARRVIFPHCDYSALSRLIEADSGTGHKFIVTESLFSMDGDIAPLAEYADLVLRTGAALIVDEAHAVGIYGATGSGLIEELGVAESVCLSINTAGKALGAAGAFVAGSELAIQYLVQRARTFVFSTAPVPALAAAIDAALDLIEAEPNRREILLRRSINLRSMLESRGLPVLPGRSQIIPIVLEDNDRAITMAESLQQAGFDVRAIRPPTVPAGTARLRISMNVKIEEPELERFAVALAAAFRQAVAIRA